MGSPMKTKILSAIFCLALLLSASKAYSDDSIVADFGKSVKPIKTNKIEMESEEVIQDSQGSADDKRNPPIAQHP